MSRVTRECASVVAAVDAERELWAGIARTIGLEWRSRMWRFVAIELRMARREECDIVERWLQEFLGAQWLGWWGSSRRLMFARQEILEWARFCFGVLALLVVIPNSHWPITAIQQRKGLQ